jgi:hypothetical protein
LFLDFNEANSKDFCINAILTKTKKFTKTMIFNSRGILKFAKITNTSHSGKTIYIQPIEPNPVSLFKDVYTNDLNNNLEIVSRKVILKI